MVLRFEVDQAEAFRQGINVPKSTNHIDVDPSTLPQEERELVADRLKGIDVCQLVLDGGRVVRRRPAYEEDVRHRIEAKAPTYEALMEAIRENQSAVQKTILSSKWQNSQVADEILSNRRKPGRAITCHNLARLIGDFNSPKAAVFKLPTDGKGGLFPVTTWKLQGGGNIVLSTDNGERVLADQLIKLLKNAAENAVVLYDDLSGSQPAQIEFAQMIDGTKLNQIGFDDYEAGVILE
jgi:hypothetical protein